VRTATGAAGADACPVAGGGEDETSLIGMPCSDDVANSTGPPWRQPQRVAMPA
jgi:hypothetical protein